MCVKITNPARQTILATYAERASTASSRNKGLLGRMSLEAGEGLWIIPSQGVHTFWMRFPIDLVYIDQKNRVKKVYASVRPWRLALCLSAHSVIELPAGTIVATRTQVGDLLQVTSSPKNMQATAQKNGAFSQVTQTEALPTGMQVVV
jgi:uncharacterized membrane protein (UPF0127 family)